MAIWGKKKKPLPTDIEEEFEEDFNIEDDDEIFSSAAGTEPGLDDGYEDEDMEEIVSSDDKKDSSDNFSEPSKKWRLIFPIVFAAVVLAALNFTGVIDFSGDSSSSSNDKNQVVDSTSVDQGKQELGEGIVVKEEAGKSYSGHDNGNPVNGTGAIMAFANAYYEQRDGKKVISVYNPEATSYDAGFVQSSIDNRVKEGTKYNIIITPEIVGKKYDATIILTPPGESSSYSIDMSFETMEKGGKFYVKTFQTDGKFKAK